MQKQISERQIAAFRAMMTTGTVSAAARRLHLSQPAVTTLLRRMQDVVGVPLFDRVANRLVATVEAQRIFEEVQLIQGQFEKMLASVAAIARGERAFFRVGATASPARRLVPRALAMLLERRPDLRCSLDGVMMDRVVDYITLGHGECLVTLAPLDDPALTSRRVADGCFVVALPAGHRLAGRERLAVADLAGEPLVSWLDQSVHGAHLVPLWREAGLPRETKIFVRTAETALGLVAEGAGIAVVDSFSVIGLGTDITVVPLDGSPVVPLWLHVARLRARSALVEELAALLPQAVEGRQPAGEV